jgi:hypothetical protein
MVPRLLFAAMVFGSLASRPDAGRHRPAPQAPVAQAAAAQPALVPAPACPRG